jgi:ABC-type transport system involved in multi-copper enzyme maturation permease subunit
MALLRAEVRRVLGRRGSIVGATIFNLLFGVGVLIWALTSDAAHGDEALHDGAGLLQVAVAISAIVLGAVAGSWDVDHGTMRYLVLTGVPRPRLALIRAPGLAIAIVVVSLPAIALVLLATAVAPGPGPQGGDGWIELFYGVWVAGIAYGLLSLTIGTFLKSSTVAITVALLVNLVGSQIAALIQDKVSHTLGDLLFSEAARIVIGREHDDVLSLGVAAVVLVVWLVALLGAAALRVQRAEY